MGEEVDSELVRRCLDGESRAFEVLMTRYERPVYNAAFRMLHNPEDARDVAQTVFLKAYEHLSEFDPARRFYSWIYRIAMNEAINALQRRVSLEPIPRDEVDGQPGPDAVLSRYQTVCHIEEALMTIKIEYRSVVVLKHILGCSYEEMAEILGLPEKTVKSRLFTARQLLKEALVATGMHRT